jgi:hypothetical protein
MAPEVILHSVVVEQGVVHVKQEHNFTGGCHRYHAMACRFMHLDPSLTSFLIMHPDS